MDIRFRDRLVPALVVAAVLLGAWFVYQPALGGTFLLDDQSNLGDLRNVDDSASAVRFVLSGTAGPSGRPIALATFLPQAKYWESGPEAFLKVNILIHLFNACLLWAFLRSLSLHRGASSADARLLALAAAAFWLFMPLLATSTLMVVQRMTTLSATFVLLGLNGYLVARRSIERSENRSLAGMSLALAAATVLAVLTKESGVLLPLFVLVMEATLLKPPSGIRRAKWRSWTAVFLWMPAALVLAYLVTRVPYSEALALRRDFGAWERVITQSHILWEYVFNAFLPRPGQYGPFHDAYPVSRSILDPLSLLALGGWVAAATLAVIRRRRNPLFAFAVLWFLAGHVLESTVLPLELYFEHRNYLPVIGLVYAFSHVLVAAPAKYRRLARAAVPLYVLVNALFLFSLTTLWGDPSLATRYWHEQFPDSVRAASTMATAQLRREGPQATLHTLRVFAREHPEHVYIGIPALSLSCMIAPGRDHREEAASVAEMLSDVRFSYTAGTMLSELLTTISQNDCEGVDRTTVRELARSLAANARYVGDSGYRQLHHQLMARIERDAGDTEEALDHLFEAIAARPSSRLNMMVVTMLVSEDRFDEARAFIEQAREGYPLHPLKRKLWQLELDELTLYVERSDSLPELSKDGITGMEASDNG